MDDEAAGSVTARVHTRVPAGEEPIAGHWKDHASRPPTAFAPTSVHRKGEGARASMETVTLRAGGRRSGRGGEEVARASMGTVITLRVVGRASGFGEASGAPPHPGSRDAQLFPDSLPPIKSGNVALGPSKAVAVIKTVRGGGRVVSAASPTAGGSGRGAKNAVHVSPMDGGRGRGVVTGGSSGGEGKCEGEGKGEGKGKGVAWSAPSTGAGGGFGSHSCSSSRFSLSVVVTCGGGGGSGSGAPR